MSACIDRSAVSTAMAKAIAYKQCGKDREAADWARQLVLLLECAEILKPAETDYEEALGDFNYVGSRHHY
jgi:hypothetical protein